MTLRTFSNKLSSIYLSNRSEGRKRYLFFVELLAIVGAYLFALFAWGKWFDYGFEPTREFYVLGIINFISWTLLVKLTIIAKIPRTQRYVQIFFNFVRVAFIELLILFMIKIVGGFNQVPYIFLIFYAGLNLFLLFHLRIFFYRIFKIFRAKGYDLHKVVIIANSFSDQFIEKVLSEKEWGFHVVKILSNSRLIREKYGKDIPVVSESTDIKEIIDNEVIDEVVYCKNEIKSEQFTYLNNVCNEVGVIFRMQSDLSPLEDLKLQLNTMNDVNQLSLTDSPGNNIGLFFKYLSDLYFSFFMLILLLPVFLFIAILIKLDSRGPVFFAQERVGLRGRRFKLFKFRTMVVDAEKVLEKLKEQNEMDGPVFKIKNDPRITRMGRILRKTGIDELPQLYNVFRGEMSLIGPRPPLPKEVAEYERWQLRRLSVKPGITCTWQIIPNRNDINFENWMKLDLQYIDGWSLKKDMVLFFKTIKTFFNATGH